MNWKSTLAKLEKQKNWDLALEFMENVIQENPSSLDAYLSICYLLMNLLVEEDYDRSKHDHYAKKLKHYFDESYQKFYNNPEYLYFIGRIGAMSEWYLDIEIEDVENMIQKAIEMDPNNCIYQWTYFKDLYRCDPSKKDKLIGYYKSVITGELPVKYELQKKGALGEYIWSIIEYCAQELGIK